MLRREWVERYTRLLQDLPREEQILVWLHAGRSLSLKEIGKALCPLADDQHGERWAKKTWRLAIRRLRETRQIPNGPFPDVWAKLWDQNEDR